MTPDTRILCRDCRWLHPEHEHCLVAQKRGFLERENPGSIEGTFPAGLYHPRPNFPHHCEFWKRR